MLELAGLVILGMLAQWVAWKLKMPAILPLILIGLLVGPIAATYFSEDGTKWIQPIYDGRKGMFPGESLFYFVSLAMSIILFEGGLTLRFREVKSVGPIIPKLIIIGSLITVFGAASLAHFLFGLSWKISFLFSALIMVTGPTVIRPILRNIPLKQDLSAILRWEGILIDPIGALVAVLIFGFISVDIGSAYTKTAFIEFGKIILFGFTFGYVFAKGIYQIVKHKLVPHYLQNLVVLAAVLGVFVLSENLARESGLLAVVIMGMVLGNSGLANLKELLYFKESLSILLVSILFILLAAHMNMDNLKLMYNWNTVILFAVVVFVLRPLGVFLSTINSPLSFNEKVFISWVGPRGIVAAGIASLFGLKLMDEGVAGAEYITPLVFMIVLGTVLLNATTARYLAKWIGVYLNKHEGILIVGASKPSRLIGNYLQKNGRHVVLLDNNQNNIDKAEELGLEAINSNIYADALDDSFQLNDVGYIIALTGNPDINQFALKKFGKTFGENGAFRLISPEELNDPDAELKEHFFIQGDDFASLTETTRKYPAIHEIQLEGKEHYQNLLEISRKDREIVPLFLKDESGTLHIIGNTDLKNENLDNDWALIYLGKPYDVEKVQEEQEAKLDDENKKSSN